MNYSWNGNKINNPAPWQKFLIIAFVISLMIVALPASIPCWFTGIKSPLKDGSWNPDGFHMLFGLAIWVVIILLFGWLPLLFTTLFGVAFGVCWIWAQS